MNKEKLIIEVSLAEFYDWYAVLKGVIRDTDPRKTFTIECLRQVMKEFDKYDLYFHQRFWEKQQETKNKFLDQEIGEE